MSKTRYRNYKSSRSIRALGATAVLAAVGVAAAGCGTITTVDPPAETTGATSEAREIKTILFDHPFTALPVVGVITSYAQQRAAELGIELKLTNDNFDLTQQITQLTSFLDRGIDAVVSFPGDPASVQPIAQQYMDAGTFWVSYANPLEVQDAFLDLDAFNAGELLGEHAGNWINENLGGTAEVLILDERSMSFSTARSDGLRKGLTETAPNATIVATQTAVTPEQGLAVTTTVLGQHPNLNVVVANAGDAAQGAYQALIASGRDPLDPSTYVGGIDGNAYGLQRMAEGAFFRALAINSPEDIGNAVIDIPIALARGDKAKNYVIPLTLVTAETPNLEALAKEFGG